MAKNNIAVFGIYSSREDSQNGVDRLIAAGFRHEDVSVLLQDNVGTKDFGHEKHTKLPEGATTGTVAGGIIGGAIGELTGIGSGGLVGGIIGALVGIGIPEYEAKRYEGRIKQGGILLSVHCDDEDWVEKAKEVLRNTGAEDIASAPEARADFAASKKPMARGAGTLS